MIRCNLTIFGIGPKRELEALSSTNSVWRKDAASAKAKI